MTIVNAWLLYRRVNALQGNAKTLNLANFRIELAETLCKMGVHQNSRGRRSELEKQIQAKQRSRKFELTRAHTGRNGWKTVFVVNIQNVEDLPT
nr:unnamed protein product [Callosobruchus chinensis]